MKLEGSCHCRAVRFSLDSRHPVPYQRCYCSICRKTQGGGGYAINLGGDAASLQVDGKDQIAVYHALLDDEDGGDGEHASSAERHFCRRCGSGLWLFDPQWPELIHPFASAIDTPLPVPPERTHMMLGSKENWVEPDVRDQDREADDYPDESIAEWHKRLGLERPE